MGGLAFRCAALRCTHSRQLLIDGAAAAVGSRAFDLLTALIDCRDRVVSKNELLKVVWPGLIVEENNLQQHISTLRKLLGGEAITTVPGRGDRFTATLTDEATTSAQRREPADMEVAPPTIRAVGNVAAPPARLLGPMTKSTRCLRR